ncbi:TPA: hypothetical protein ACSP3W_004341, partial [Aeromonas veronii]
MEIIQRKGVTNFGYYPDDFHNNQPDPAVLKPVLSVQTQPQPTQLPATPVAVSAAKATHGEAMR